MRIRIIAQLYHVPLFAPWRRNGKHTPMLELFSSAGCCGLATFAGGIIRHVAGESPDWRDLHSGIYRDATLHHLQLAESLS